MFSRVGKVKRTATQHCNGWCVWIEDVKVRWIGIGQFAASGVQGGDCEDVFVDEVAPMTLEQYLEAGV